MTHSEVEDSTAEKRFGSLVKESRESRGWSQEALARRLRDSAGIDLHQSAIARLERGERPIRLNEAAALARILNLDLRPFSPTADAPVITSEEECEQAYEALTAMENQEAELREKLRQVQKEYDDQTTLIRASLQLLAETRVKQSMAIRQFRDGQRG